MGYNLKDSQANTIVRNLGPNQVEQLIRPKSDPDEAAEVVTYIKRKTIESDYKIVGNHNWGE